MEALVASFPPDTVVVSGGCRGVDSWAEAAARHRGLQVAIHLPDLPETPADYYDTVKAYYARNEKIVLDCDFGYAFVAPDRKGGTENTLRWATLHKKTFHIR